MSAFSNGTEWDCWSANWCNRCVHDQNIDEGGCILILQALLDHGTPEEWVPDQPNSLGNQYICTKFQRSDDHE